MLDLETELRTALRDATSGVHAPADMETRITRRLRAKRRMGRVVAALVAAAVITGAALTAGALIAHRSDNSIRSIAPPEPQRVLLEVPAGHWAPIASPPMTDAYASVWIGDELVVAFRAPNVRFAAYDPRLDLWSRIPDPPIEILADFTGDSTFVWSTGQGLLVWGYENHGVSTFSGHHRLLSYDPGTRRWKQLANPPIEPLIQAHPIWTGRELIVWGGNFNGELAPAQGAAYDPATNRWRRIATAPLSTRENPTIVWTGREMIAWGGLTNEQQAKPDRFEGAAYNPDANTWRPVAASGLPPMELAAAAWTGREMVVFGWPVTGGSRPDVGAAYNPATNTWRPIATTPLSQREQMAFTWTGREMVVSGGLSSGRVLGDSAAYDPASNRWRMLPPAPIPPRFSATMAWTGQFVILTGGSSEAATAPAPGVPGAAAYRP
jgi:hypothetical protein